MKVGPATAYDRAPAERMIRTLRAAPAPAIKKVQLKMFVAGKIAFAGEELRDFTKLVQDMLPVPELAELARQALEIAKPLSNAEEPKTDKMELKEPPKKPFKGGTLLPHLTGVHDIANLAPRVAVQASLSSDKLGELELALTEGNLDPMVRLKIVVSNLKLMTDRAAGLQQQLEAQGLPVAAGELEGKARSVLAGFQQVEAALADLETDLPNARTQLQDLEAQLTSARRQNRPRLIVSLESQLALANQNLGQWTKEKDQLVRQKSELIKQGSQLRHTLNARVKHLLNLDKQMHFALTDTPASGAATVPGDDDKTTEMNVPLFMRDPAVVAILSDTNLNTQQRAERLGDLAAKGNNLAAQALVEYPEFNLPGGAA